MHFAIYKHEIREKRGKRIKEFKAERIAEVEAGNVREALQAFAEEQGLDTTVKRDGGGVLYLGPYEHLNARIRARAIVDEEYREEHERRYTKGQPLGMPPVLAQALERSDWS